MKNPQTYTVFGLGIHSALPLPELTCADVKADAHIALGCLELPAHLTNDHGFGFHITPQQTFLHWPDVGKFAVRCGTEILVEPTPGVDETVLRVFLLGPVLAALLHQRGLTVLHASAVSIDGVAVVFAADKGYGKSTTAAALYSRGHPFISDDLVALDMMSVLCKPLVLPAYPQFKMWPEALTSVGLDPEALPRLRSEYEKRAWRVQSGFVQIAVPLGAIFILGGGATLNIHPLPPQIALLELLRHLYAARYGSAAFQGDTAHFQTCAQLVQSTPVYRVARRQDLSELEIIAQQIEQRVRQPSVPLHATGG